MMEQLRLPLGTRYLTEREITEWYRYVSQLRGRPASPPTARDHVAAEIERKSVLVRTQLESVIDRVISQSVVHT